MKTSIALCSLAALVLASTANAATLYVSPTGTATSGCTRAEPCSLDIGGGTAMAGDTVILMDGVYKTSLYVTNSGTESAWITFKADECATPIIEGKGAGPTEDIQDSGVGSAEAEYVRFQGIVARGWNIGFGNGWAGGVEEDRESNGHWEIENCISYSNGRTGFTFFSASNFTLKNSISAHNGSSQKHAWSSGVTLFEAAGTNRVEGVISFENTDHERKTDGSGFIVDEQANNATFVNNIAFGNSGSCFRLTDSRGTIFINNTCYRNSQFGGEAMAPSNPGEIYFTDDDLAAPGNITHEGVNFANNVIVGTGQSPAGSQPVVNQPTTGWSNTNVVTTNGAGLFKAPDGANPDFTPMGELVGGGSGGGAPGSDIGFDPKCIVKRDPVLVGSIAKVSTWQYDIDIEYIQSIGGVAKCFNPKMRSGTPDIGAYQSGDVTTVMPGSCVPPADPEPPVGGAGGMGGGGGAGGAPSPGGTAGDNAGGVPTAGTAGAPSPGGGGNAGGPTAEGGSGGSVVAPVGGASGSGGAPAPTAGTPSTGTGGSATGAGGAKSTGGAPGASGSSNPGTTPPPASEDSGCGCRVAPQPRSWHSVAGLGLLGLGALALQRRRRAR